MPPSEARIDARGVAALDCVKVNDRAPSVKTVSYWMVRGVRGVRLESELRAGRRVTTAAAVRRFLDAINSASPAPAPASA